MRLCEDILTAVGVSSPSLLGLLLEGTFSDVVNHLRQLLSLEDSPSAAAETRKRPADLPPVTQGKKERRSADDEEERCVVKVVRRGGEVMDIRTTDGTKRLQRAKHGGPNISSDVSLSLSWSSDTGRCVDASPVLLIRGEDEAKAEASVFIGSHSHRMQAVDLLSGTLLWEQVFRDRIESSAAVSRCGTLVVVGQHLRVSKLSPDALHTDCNEPLRS